MVIDYPTVKNACLEQNLFNDGSKSLSVSESKYPGKRVYNVWFVAYYSELYKGIKLACGRNDRGAKSKTYFKEFLTFEEAKEAFYNYDNRSIINQAEEYLYIPLFEYVPFNA
jgi:hypothetical protein